MYALQIKKWLGHIHMPRGHNTVLRLEHLAHNRRFWSIVATAALIAGFIILAILVGLLGNWNTDTLISPARPFAF